MSFHEVLIFVLRVCFRFSNLLKKTTCSFQRPCGDTRGTRAALGHEQILVCLDPFLQLSHSSHVGPSSFFPPSVFFICFYFLDHFSRLHQYDSNSFLQCFLFGQMLGQIEVDIVRGLYSV